MIKKINNNIHSQSETIIVTRPANKITQLIRGYIVDGHIKAGDKLTEVKFADELKVSRTPLREAFIKLEEEGFLIKKTGSYRVRSFTLIEVEDAIKLRGVLEGAAANMAAEQKPPASAFADIKSTVAKIDHILSKGKLDQYNQLNSLFHHQLIDLSGSSYIIAEVLRSYRFPFSHPSGFATNKMGIKHLHQTIKKGNSQHKKIIQAIEKQDGLKAFALTVNHSKLTLDNVETAFLTRAKTQQQHPSLALVV